MSLRILHLAPLWHPVKKDAPGGIETLLAELVQSLNRLGHQNSIIAAGNSELDGELISAVETSVCEKMKEGSAQEYVYYEQQQLSLAVERASEFDIIHSHVGPGAFSLSRIPALKDRVLHTHHGPVYKDLQWFLKQRSDLWFSTVSHSQFRNLGNGFANSRWRLIHNGINLERFDFNPVATPELLFMGRIERAKGPDLAVNVAREIQAPLRIAGPILDSTLFKETIEPHLNGQIQYLGVLNHSEKVLRFGQSKCFLMPSRWEEPFGLVAIEAMACGTPVVGLARGALPEIVEHGVTGFLASEPAQLAGLVEKACLLDRAKVRSHVAEKFNIEQVAKEYSGLYEEMRRSS